MVKSKKDLNTKGFLPSYTMKFTLNILMVTMLLIGGIFLTGCTMTPEDGNEKPSENGNEVPNNVATPYPDVIVYKMDPMYEDKVGVGVLPNSTEIFAFPGPSDVNQNAGPTKLKKGYYYSGTTFGENTVFLNITYAKYSNRSKPFSVDRMQDMIIDYESPITEMYECNDQTNPALYSTDRQAIISDLNTLIAQGNLSSCKTIV